MNEAKARALSQARLHGRNIGHDCRFVSEADDNRELELAFLEGFLSTRDRKDGRGGPRWVPKE
jgi:hypothetical protein